MIVRKYLGLFWAILQASAISEFEFRFNIVVRIFTDVLWYVAQLSLFEVIFGHISDLNGWTLQSIRVFMGILFVTDSIYMFLFQENLDRLGAKIRRGDLDLLLVKPVSSQWLLSLNKLSVPYLGNFILSGCWLAWSLVQIPDLQPVRVFWLVLMIPCGVMIVYSIRFMVASSALFITQSEAISQIWWQIYRLGTRPDNIYPSVLRLTILTFLPIGFLASVPARLVLGRAGPEMAVLGIIVMVGLLWSSCRLWQFGLSQYSSASS